MFKRKILKNNIQIFIPISFYYVSLYIINIYIYKKQQIISLKKNMFIALRPRFISVIKFKNNN